MVVFLLENVPVSLRGEITRWMLELRAGVFVGNISAMVRDKLWSQICDKIKKGNALMLQSASNEQGYRVKSHGQNLRKIRDFDGLQLITISQSGQSQS